MRLIQSQSEHQKVQEQSVPTQSKIISVYQQREFKCVLGLPNTREACGGYHKIEIGSIINPRREEENQHTECAVRLVALGMSQAGLRKGGRT